jgi:hypothetical protein
MINEKEISELAATAQTATTSTTVVVDPAFILLHRNQEIVKKLFPKEITKSDFEIIILPWILEGKMPDAAWKRLSSTTSSGRSLSGRFKASFKKTAAQGLFSEQIKASLKTALSTQELSEQDEAEIEECCTEQAIRSMDRPPLRIPPLNRLHEFIGSLNQTEKEQPKVACFIQWLKKKFDPEKNKHINKLNNFFIVYEVAKKVAHYGFAMKDDDNGELLKRLSSMIEKYFVKGFKVPEVLPEEIKKFDDAYTSLSKDKKTKWVEEFFKNWFANNVEKNNDDDDDDAATNSQTRAELFCKLCNPDYQACIRISDQVLNDGYEQYNRASNAATAATKDGDYFLSLCLLYALAVPVGEWSVTFHTILQKLFKKTIAYPRELLQQINYLLECYLAESAELEKRPELVVLTPALIETTEDVQTAFNYIASAAAGGQCPRQFIPDAVSAVKAKIKSISGNDLAARLSQFKEDTYRLLVVEELLGVLDSLDCDEVIKLLATVENDSSRLKLLIMLEKKLPSFLSEDAIKLFSLFKDDAQHPRVLKIIKHNLPKLTEETVKLISLFKGDARRLRVFKIVRDNLLSLTCEATTKFISLFESEEHRLKALRIIQTKLPIFDKKETDLVLAQFKTVEKRQEASALIAATNASKLDQSKEVAFGDNPVEFCSWLKTLSEKAEITGVKLLQELCIECKANLSSTTAKPTFFRPVDKEHYSSAMEKMFDFIRMNQSLSTQDAVNYLSRLLEANGKQISDIGRMLKAASKAVLTRYEVSISEDTASVSSPAAAEDEEDASTSSSSLSHS